MKIPSLIFLLRSTGGVLRRFPVVAVAAVIGVVALMAILENDKSPDTVRLWMMALLGVPLFTGLTAFAESHDWTLRDWRYWALNGAGVALLILYGFALPDPHEPHFDEVDVPRYLAVLGVVHLFVAVAPYLNRLPVADFWEYNKQLFASFIVGATFTLILWGGLALAVLAAQRLFDFNIDEKVYVHLFVLLAGLFNTTFFLHHFPRHFRFETPEQAYNSIFKNLCKYILIPIVGLYFLILYAYSAKILVNWWLPRGWVASLVIGFSVAGIFTYLLNYQLPQYDQSPIVRNYRRWFWWVMLPLVALLFVAIYRRIGDYGVTPPRFIICAIGLWLLVTGLYFAISRTDNIKFIPISLGIFALLSVFGPFNAFNVSERNQLEHLESLLIKNGRMAAGQVLKAKTDFTGADAQRVTDVLYWLDQRGSLDRIQSWIGQPIDSLPPAPKGNFGRVGRVTNLLGIRSARNDYSNLVRVSPNGLVNTGNIRGYTTWYRVELNEYSNPPGMGRYFEPRRDRFSA